MAVCRSPTSYLRDICLHVRDVYLRDLFCTVYLVAYHPRCANEGPLDYNTRRSPFTNVIIPTHAADYNGYRGNKLT